MARTPVRPYRWLAKYYDTIFTFRSFLAPARAAVVYPLLKHVKSGCDLACGTGTTAIELAQKGVKMYGVDLSPGMCRASRAKVKRAGADVTILDADMRTFRLPEPVDLVLCEFDALNHVPKKADLARVVKCVYRALNAGGYFYFDVNTRQAFEELWPLTYWIDTPTAAVVMGGGFDVRTDKAYSDVEWFIRKGKTWRREHERVEQVYWPATQIRETLRAAGFRTIRAWDGCEFLQAGPSLAPGYRTFYLARK